MRKHGHGMHGGDLDFAAQTVGIEGILEILHRRKQLGHQIPVVVRHHLVADIDEYDFAGRVEGEDVSGDPVLGEGRVGCHTRNVGVGYSDHDPDSGVGEGLDDCRVRPVESDLLDCRRLEELRRRLRRREIVGDLAVVHSDERLRFW